MSSLMSVDFAKPLSLYYMVGYTGHDKADGTMVRGCNTPCHGFYILALGAACSKSVASSL